MEDVQYTPQAEMGKQCKDCQFFEVGGDNPETGKCFGHDVVATGGCNKFVPKG